jgi:FAD/FMN-containing dehydrogenase/Fe-S oxidoreductase
MIRPKHHKASDGFAARLRREVQGEVLFDRFSRGRYSTDASFYQIDPIGVVIPRTEQDLTAAFQMACDAGIPVVPRGAGTSQCGQTIGEAIIIDTSKYLTRVTDLDVNAQTVVVEPGIVLDQLNAWLRPHGLFFPVDVATASQATLGGMAGNNSAGARSIRYGLMVDNVRAIDAVLTDGAQLHFGEAPGNLADLTVDSNGTTGQLAYTTTNPRYADLVRTLRALREREGDEIAKRVPAVLRHVAGYNLHRVSPDSHNMADLLVGSEGTLALFSRLHLHLHRVPPHKVLGVCHFPRFPAAADAVQHVVELEPTAVEMVDRRLIELARANPAFRGPMDRFVKGEPEALLLVEFAGDNHDELIKSLDRLEELMGGLGFPNAVVRAAEPEFQREIWSVRKAALNIVMSMKDDRKPVSFIEDCAVPLEHLAEYTSRLTEVFRKHDTSGTWYAHASVGCLHIRPILNLKDKKDLKAMRAIADDAHAMVREFKGSHSGEHGDGLVRSEFLEPMLGGRLVRAFEEIKSAFDPASILNPGKIVHSPRMDDQSLFRFPPDYQPQDVGCVLDWSDWQGLSGAVEMCNNNGACRKSTPDVMCPSYRVTHDEKHLTRGRANTLRLALSGQLGTDAFTSDAMYDTMDLCVGCKACKRECPTGVDMARMKTEFLYHYRRRHGLSLRDRLVAYLPRYAPWAARVPILFNAGNHSRFLAGLGERITGFSALRRLPTWRRDVFKSDRRAGGLALRDGHRLPEEPCPSTSLRTGEAGRLEGRRPPQDSAGRRAGDSEQHNRPEVVLLLDTFNTYFEPENARAALNVLEAAGYDVVVPEPVGGGRPLCCGRTFLNVGLVDEAKVEARRVLETLRPYIERRLPIVGLEPSCLLTLRDEFMAMLPGADTARLADRAMLFEEFLDAEEQAGRLRLSLEPTARKRILVHGHCHQKAFGLMDSLRRVLRWIPDADVQLIESGCCGMAGSFGYAAEHYDASLQMAELELLPAVREAARDAWLVADGTSCRAQILDGSGRQSVHVALVLEAALQKGRR